MATILLDHLDQTLRAILSICPSPAAHDVVTIHRTGEGVVAAFPDHSQTFVPADPHLALAVESFKRDVRRCTEAERRKAMCHDAGLAHDARPLWLNSSHVLVAEWIEWAGQELALEQQCSAA